MINMVKATVFAFACMLLSAVSAAGGDIYEIRPCDRNGATTTGYTSADSPISVSGKKLYFNLRLVARTSEGDPWRLVHKGYGDEVVDDALTPLQIGIYVSGRRTYATLVDWKVRDDNSQFTDFIFEYTTKSGDFALPVTLATNVGPADEGGDGTEYYLNPLRKDKWSIENANGDVCNLWFFAGSPERPSPSPVESDGRETDHTLRNCGFYVQTIDFDGVYDNPSTTPKIWRTVHQGSSQTNPETPKLVASSPIEGEAPTLYVWSTNENAVRIEGGEEMTIVTGYVGSVPQTAKVQMGKVTLAGNSVSKDFRIFGVAQNGEADLVLSAWPGYRFDATNTRIDDAVVTRHVKCIQPLPASVVVEADRPTAIADSNYYIYKARLSVYLTQPYADGAVEVTVLPQFEDNHTGNWGDYVRFSTSESLQTLPSAEAPPKVVIPPGSTDKRYIYMYALRSDAHTVGTGHQMKFVPKISAEVQAAAKIESLVEGGLNIGAEKPIVTIPDSAKEQNIVSGETVTIPAMVQDTYADITDEVTGYQVKIKTTDSSNYTTLSERFVASGEGGALVGITNGKPPAIEYTKSGTHTSEIVVISPISGKESDRVTFTVNVSQPTTSTCETTDDKDGIYTEGDTVPFRITLSEEHGEKQAIYAFLLCESDADVSMFGGNPCIVTNKNVAQSGLIGRQIPVGGKVATGSFTVLDGFSEDDGGQNYTFSVVLCRSKTWNPSEVLPGFTTLDRIDIRVYNKEPVFTSEPVYVNGFPAAGDGVTYTNQFPVGQSQTIQPNFDDVSYDLKNGFTYKWTAYCDNKPMANGEVKHGKVDEVTVTTNATKSIITTVPTGTNINDAPFQYKFERSGIWTIKIQMKDKDMTNWSPLSISFNVIIIKSPQVEVIVPEFYTENELSYITVGLGYYDAVEPIVVKLTVTPPEGDNPGVFKLDSEYTNVLKRVNGQPFPALQENEYYVPFKDSLPLQIRIDEMDGTDLSTRKGFGIKAEVVSDEPSTDDTKSWSEFYLPKLVKASVHNVSPISYMESSTNVWVVSGGFANSRPINWSVASDVPNDFTFNWKHAEDNILTNGVRVSITGCDNEKVMYFDSAASGRFVPNFGSRQGPQTVTIMIEDKDSAVSEPRTYTYQYFVTASKFLTTTATGPSGGTASSKLSQRYALASGVGEGHTYVGSGALFIEAKDFRLKWNLSNANDADLYAYGYKVAAPLDNGKLDGGKDIAISKTGSATADVKIDDADCYHYKAATDSEETLRKDSYLYCWIQHTLDEGGKYVSFVMGDMPAPERPGSPTVANVALPRTAEEDGSYVSTSVEAIFAKEWRVADNLGDINQDGVPDAFAVRTWGNGNLVELLIEQEADANAAAGGGEDGTELTFLDRDLRNIANFNPANDRLPGVATQDGLQDFGDGVKSSYAPIGLAFPTRMKLRGFHSGLNAVDLTRSDADFSKDEKKAYDAYIAANNIQVEGIDLLKWSPEPGSGSNVYRYKLTIDTTKVDPPFAPAEEFEYGEFIYSSSIDPTGNVAFYTEAMSQIASGLDNGGYILVNEGGQLALQKKVGEEIRMWAVTAVREKMGKAQFGRMDPTMLDTDGDGFPDGWEYFFWYLAHVDYPARGNNKLRRPGQKFVFEHFNRNNILEGYEIKPEAVETRYNPCDPVTVATLKKYPDFDGDGLSDFEELAIGTNPCHWDTDGDKMCDGWEVMSCLDPLHESRTTDANLDGDFMAFHSVAGKPVYIDQTTERHYEILDTLVPGADYDPAGFVTLRELKVKVAGYNDAGRIYGHPDDTGAWGLPMVTAVAQEEIVIPAGSTLTMGLNHIFIHNQVYDAFGFDPRTAWGMNKNGYVADRWDPSINKAYSAGDAGRAINTRAYTAYDEYLIAMYRGFLGIPAGGNMGDSWSWLRFMTTNPSVAYKPTVEKSENEEGEEVETVVTNLSTIAQMLAEALQASGSGHTPVITHGADTDQDGVPDGWELYTKRNPSYLPPTGPENDLDGDALAFAAEYAGTDSCGVYGGCASIANNHPGKANGWFNKFFPTDPDLPDTDSDGITDGQEGSAWGLRNTGIFYHDGVVSRVTFNFIYGSPADNNMGCIRGGGMNPCTIDTDEDGIPDGWEMQFAGIPFDVGARQTVAPNNVAISDATLIADGLFKDTGKQGQIIVGGMDATWAGDAVTDVLNTGRSFDAVVGATRDVDFDHDGLQNWQEYLVQSLRHFRYDDISTPLMGRMLDKFTEDKYSPDSQLLQAHNQQFLGFVTMDSTDPMALAVNAAEAWGLKDYIKTLTVTTGTSVVVNDIGNGEKTTNVVYYTEMKKVVEAVPATEIITARMEDTALFFQQPWNDKGWRNLGYFSTAEKYWDRANLSARGYVYMMPVIKTIVRGEAGYVSTDPRRSDTDADGMGDFYEIFHGLNPILGGSPETAGVNDIIAETYAASNGVTIATFNAFFNEWTHPDYNSILGRVAGIQPTGMDPASGENTMSGTSRLGPILAPEAYDPILYPWIMGTPLVDADGDGLRNEEERILANVTSPTPSHTDPTPLWFTERTTPASFVWQYYVEPAVLNALPFRPGVSGADYSNAVIGSDGDYLSTLNGTTPRKYSYSFEESEGYDTDNDFLVDGREIIKTVRAPTDPLRFDDPDRRQALYLDGVNSFAMSYNPHIRVAEAGDLFKQFTVECWVMPERHGVAQTIIDRCSAYEGNAINKDGYAIRSNFRIGMSEDGRVYGMFDNSDSIESGLNQPVSCQRVDGQILPLNQWSHVALTYNGSELCIYVNGGLCDSATTTLIPANGVINELQDPTNPSLFTSYSFSAYPCAFFIGARPKKQNLYALMPYSVNPLTGEHMESFDNLQEYFRGYVDEVRVWDGAKTGSALREMMGVYMTREQVLENRNTVFGEWTRNATRNDNDGRPMLPVELVLHYNFVTLPGSVHAGAAAQTPVGFYKSALAQATAVEGYWSYEDNPDLDRTGLYGNLADLKGGQNGFTAPGALMVGWWKDCLVRNTVYKDYHVVPWIENSVSHLPYLDGGTADSFIYSDTLAGLYTPAFVHGLAKFSFPNTGMPYQGYNHGYNWYHKLYAYDRLLSQRGEGYAAVNLQYRYMLRSRFLGTTDLIPLGGAYSRTCAKLWDETVADAWEISGADKDGNGLPDWWEEYARENYCKNFPTDMDINWDTIVDYHGLMIPAYQAYWTDLYRGMIPDETGKNALKPESTDHAYASNSDRDSNNIPDWWESLFNVTGFPADADLDNDGLSNYAEYLLSFGKYPYGLDNGFPLLDPRKTRTGLDQKVVDYFLPGPAADALTGNVTNIYKNQYVGEIATDHDFMENWWENSLSSRYTDSRVYDPVADKDEDGWSNFAETRAALWGGSYVADLIDRFTEYGVHEELYPKPAIGLKISYYGIRDVSDARLVVRTSNGKSETMDAKFVLTPGPVGNMQHIGQINANSVMRGFMSPGSVLANTVVFSKTPLLSDSLYRWDWSWYIENGYIPTNSSIVTSGNAVDYKYYKMKYPNIVGAVNGISTEWENFAKAVPDAQGRYAKIVHIASDTEIGGIDLRTGEWEMNTTVLATVDSNTYDLGSCLMRVEYSTQLGSEWPKTVWLCDTKQYSGGDTVGSGYVKEGINYIEAFLDLNNDGLYTAGEPFAAKKGIEIFWHKTDEILMELRELSPVAPRINLNDSSVDRIVIKGSSSGVQISENAAGTATDTAGIKTLNIERFAINGKTCRIRRLFSRSYLTGDRAYLSEGDIVSESMGKFDLDWNYLRADAEAALERDELLLSATYRYVLSRELVDGSVSNEVVGVFIKTFDTGRPGITPVSPASDQSVYSASPVFSFKCDDENATAFAIQVFDESSDTLVWESGVKLLPGRSFEAGSGDAALHSFTPEIYAGESVSTNGAAIFEDGKVYKWRIAAFNAAFPLSTFEEKDWSDFVQFRMDVGNNAVNPQFPMGYGSVAAVVRYFGPSTNAVDNAIVVEAFSSADFSGQALGRTRVRNVADLRSISDITTTNAVMVGVRAGEVFLRAYIDANNNGRLDKWESWGYANKVGTSSLDIYTPERTQVLDSLTICPSAVIFIEDTDINRNETPDCIEDVEFGEVEDLESFGDDADRDGLPKLVENELGTKPNSWDTDGDGMPDGWENSHNPLLDPLNNDATLIGSADDLMAYAEVSGNLVSVSNTTTGVSIAYLLPEGMALPFVGDDMTGKELYSVYAYGDKFGMGRLVTVTNTTNAASDEMNRVVGVYPDSTVVLVHAQVYDAFGFSAKTCVSGTDAVNTKLMTALDKYLVVRYLEAIGLADEVSVNTNRLWKDYTLTPGVTDSDLDGIADGWELYTMFGPQGVESATQYGSIADTAISPWNYADARANGPTGMWPLYEFDRGNAPTDPWQTDSNADGILDEFAFMYHLKGDSALADADNDGLSNYAEYLLSEVFDLGVKFDPDNAYSISEFDSDYFFRVGDLYVGEIFTDHDMVEDSLEDRWGFDYVSRYLWDASSDRDEDEWSAFAEARYNRYTGAIQADKVSHYVGELELRDAPSPTINLTVRYNGTQTIGNAPIVVRANSYERPPSLFASPADALYTITPGEKQTGTKYLGEWGRRTVRGFLNPGYIVPETFEIEMASINSSDSYTVKVTGLAALNPALGAQYPDGTYAMSYDEYIYLLNLFGSEYIQLQVEEFTWSRFIDDSIITLTQDQDGKKGYICLLGVRIGTVDLITGEYSLDLTLLGEIRGYQVDGDEEAQPGDDNDTTGDTDVYDENHPTRTLQQSSFRISYETLVPTMQERKLTLNLGDTANGYLREGTNMLVVFYDLDNNSEYTPGEPMGVVYGVEVGWYGATAEVELTDTTPIFTRIDLTTGATDRDKLYGTDVSDKVQPGLPAAYQGNEYVRLRVLREGFVLAGGMLYTLDGSGVTNRVLVDKYISISQAKFLTEGDILETGDFDVDWSYAQKDVFKNANAHSSIRNGDVVGLVYKILLGDKNETQELALRSIRYFDYKSVRQKPRLVSPGETDSVVYAPRPTFKWTMSTNNTYMAFKLQILTKNREVVWDSGVRRAPARDSDNNYYFRPDVFVGDGLENNSNYLWRVSMYNSKFQDDFWSSEDYEFRMNTVDHGYTYGSIPVCVKYFGPGKVFSNSVVRVEAYTTPDFSGEPVARSVVREDRRDAVCMTNTAHEASVTLTGLPEGQYFIRAWLDFDESVKYGTVCRRDENEAWGYFCAREADPENPYSPVPVKVAIADGASQMPTVYIEDPDRNNNGIPDSYEIVYNGGKLDDGAGNTDTTIDGDIAINDELAGNLSKKGGNGPVASGMQSMIASTFKSRTFAALSMGVSPNQVNVAPNGSILVESEVKGVQIASFAFDKNGDVAMTLTADLSAVDLTSGIYNVVIADKVGVKCTIYRKTSLSDAEWTAVSSVDTVLGNGETSITIPLGEPRDSGFFRVAVEQ